MTISPANRALLERKFGRALPAGDPKVTLTVSAIAKLLDAARAEEQPTRPKTEGERAADNIEAVLDRCTEILRAKK
jgi:hypothetical protein